MSIVFASNAYQMQPKLDNPQAQVIQMDLLKIRKALTGIHVGNNFQCHLLKSVA